MHYKNSIITALAFIFVHLSAKTHSYGPMDEATSQSEHNKEIYAEAEKISCQNNQAAADHTCSVCNSYCVYWPSENKNAGESAEQKEPVDFGNYAFEAEVFAMCAKGSRNDEQRHTCEELADTMRLMKRLGQKNQVKTKALVDGISKLTESQRVIALRKLILEAGTNAQSEWKNGRIYAYQVEHNASPKDVESVYFDTFLKNMAGNDPQTYFKLKSMLKVRVSFMDPFNPLSVCKSAFLHRSNY